MPRYFVDACSYDVRNLRVLEGEQRRRDEAKGIADRRKFGPPTYLSHRQSLLYTWWTNSIELYFDVHLQEAIDTLHESDTIPNSWPRRLMDYLSIFYRLEAIPQRRLLDADYERIEFETSPIWLFDPARALAEESETEAEMRQLRDVIDAYQSGLKKEHVAVFQDFYKCADGTAPTADVAP